MKRVFHILPIIGFVCILLVILWINGYFLQIREGLVEFTLQNEYTPTILACKIVSNSSNGLTPGNSIFFLNKIHSLTPLPPALLTILNTTVTTISDEQIVVNQMKSTLDASYSSVTNKQGYKDAGYVSTALLVQSILDYNTVTVVSLTTTLTPAATLAPTPAATLAHTLTNDISDVNIPLTSISTKKLLLGLSIKDPQFADILNDKTLSPDSVVAKVQDLFHTEFAPNGKMPPLGPVPQT